MKRTKPIRQRGKLGLSRVFSELNIGDKVALVRDLSFKASFPKTWQGRTGKVTEKKGRAYVIKVYDGNKLKTVTVKRINLKKLPN